MRSNSFTAVLLSLVLSFSLSNLFFFTSSVAAVPFSGAPESYSHRRAHEVLAARLTDTAEEEVSELEARGNNKGVGTYYYVSSGPVACGGNVRLS